MCVPLWIKDRIIGALHVDTPLRVGTFTADDLDLLTALGNFGAVAIERARLQQRVEEEQRIRERLSRYHSPGVVEEIVSEPSQGVEKVRTRNDGLLLRHRRLRRRRDDGAGRALSS
jgi:adenylate cyclase